MYGIKPKRSLGQVFLISRHIAHAEAVHAIGKNALEIGPGYGILTAELCRSAKRVVSVEKDKTLFDLLKRRIKSRKLKLINKDFFDANDDELELGSTDIMIANIPYALSSKTIDWLSRKRIPAVLCLQKEFVEHMLAKEDTGSYSKLSVISALSFRTTKIMDVPKGHFRPMPKVDSSIIFLKPLETKITGREKEIISALMQHKKKTVRNAMVDSSSQLGKGKKELSAIMENLGISSQRVFKLSPRQLLALSSEISSLLE